MILLEQEDVVRLGMNVWTYYYFFVHWDPNDPEEWAEGSKLDFPDILSDGPFVLVVNDDHAWAGRDAEHLHHVAGRRYDTPNLRRWRYLADLYVAEMGISRQSLLLRFASMRRQTHSAPRQWFPWDQVYHWPEGGDLAWSSLLYGGHDTLKVREHEGQREVMYGVRPR